MRACRFHHAFSGSKQQLTGGSGAGARDTSVLHSFLRFVLDLALPGETPWGSTDHVIVVFDGGAAGEEQPAGKARPVNYRKQLLAEYKVCTTGHLGCWCVLIRHAVSIPAYV